jgi:hypothetical protein
LLFSSQATAVGICAEIRTRLARHAKQGQVSGSARQIGCAPFILPVVELPALATATCSVRLPRPSQAAKSVPHDRRDRPIHDPSPPNGWEPMAFGLMPFGLAFDYCCGRQATKMGRDHCVDAMGRIQGALAGPARYAEHLAHGTALPPRNRRSCRCGRSGFGASCGAASDGSEKGRHLHRACRPSAEPLLPARAANNALVVLGSPPSRP